jgi:hypothetical protein
MVINEIPSRDADRGRKNMVKTRKEWLSGFDYPSERVYRRDNFHRVLCHSG